MNETEQTEATDNVASENENQNVTEQGTEAAKDATQADTGLFGTTDSQGEAKEADGEQKGEERPEWLDTPSLKKFANGSELANGYLELERKFFEKHEVPENYDYKETFEKTGIQIHDEDQLGVFLGEAKEMGVSQKVMDWMITRLGEQNQILLQNFGPPTQETNEPPINIEAKMREEWGSDFEKNSKSVHEFGQKNFHSDVYNSLRSTPEGIKYIHAQMKRAVGANPVDGSNAVSSDGMTLEKVKALTGDPRYWDTNHPEHDAFGRYVREQFNRFADN